MIVTVKNKQSLMDVTVENYGQIDNLVEVSNDNGKSISEALETNSELTVNNEGKGDQEIKDKITTQRLSFNNNKIPSIVLGSWFLPSTDALEAMYTNLHLFGLGGFAADLYWSSSEISSNNVFVKDFNTGTLFQVGKANIYRVRACRSFIADSGSFSLRDTGPTGGLIFFISGTTFYESILIDQSVNTVWSNINTLIGATAQGTVIGTGETNTIAIINQAGHINSAAKLCNDLN